MITSTFLSNQAFDGGAIYGNGPVTIGESTFKSNTAEYKGGAIYKNDVQAGGPTNNDNIVLAIDHTVFDHNVADDGGAVYNESVGGVTLTVAKFTNNVAQAGDLDAAQFVIGGDGGAVYMSWGDLSAVNSLFKGNNAAHSGGALFLGRYIYAAPETATTSTIPIGTTTITGSQFLNNTATGSTAPPPTGSQFPRNPALGYGEGGAISANEGQLKISTSTFSGNKTSYRGGAIAIGGAAMTPLAFAQTPVPLPGATIDTSTFSGNLLTGGNGDCYGSAIDVGRPTTIANSTFANNACSQNYSEYGGAVHVYADTGLYNDTFANNRGPTSGNILQYGGTLTIGNTILAGGSPDNCDFIGGSQVSLGSNISSDASCSSALTAAGDRNGVNPKLGPLQNNGGPTFTMALLSGSPAIDHGLNSTCSNSFVKSVDQRGHPRFTASDPICDIGAHEGTDDQ